MKIALICTNADLSGAPIHVLDLATGMSRRGYEVLVILGSEGPITENLRGAGIEVEVVDCMKSRISPLNDCKAILTTRSILRKFRPKIVHAHSSKAGLVARLAVAGLSMPVVYTVHGWGFGIGRKLFQSLFIYCAELVLLPFTARLVAVSYADVEYGKRWLGISRGSIIAVHNGIDGDGVKATPASSKVVIMVARNDYQKDYKTFLAAVADLDCEAWCVGRGTDETQFKEFANQTAHGRALCLGARSDVKNLLGNAAIFVLASRYEGLPISIIEAMRAGLPIVATEVGGVGELVVDEWNGFLIPPADVKKMRSKIRLLLADSRLRETMGSRSREAFESGFDRERMLTKIEEIYKSVVAGEHGALQYEDT